jgi:hypothetical protein
VRHVLACFQTIWNWWNGTADPRRAAVLPGGSICSIMQAPELTLLGSWRHWRRLTRCARTPTPPSSLSAFLLDPGTSMAPKLPHRGLCALLRRRIERQSRPRRSRHCCASRGQSPGTVQHRVERCDEARVPPHHEQSSGIPRSRDWAGCGGPTPVATPVGRRRQPTHHLPATLLSFAEEHCPPAFLSLRPSPR